MIVKSALSAFLACSGIRGGKLGVGIGGYDGRGDGSDTCLSAHHAAAMSRLVHSGRPSFTALRYQVDETDFVHDVEGAAVEKRRRLFFRRLVESTATSPEDSFPLSLEMSPGGIRGVSTVHFVESPGTILLRVPLERCIVQDLVDGSNNRMDDASSSSSSMIPRRLRDEDHVGARLAASILLKLEKERRYPSSSSSGVSGGHGERAWVGPWADLLPRYEEVRPGLPLHWPHLATAPPPPPTSAAPNDVAMGGGQAIAVNGEAIVEADIADPGPGYSILSRAVNLYGRSTVDRALEVYKSRSGAPEETGLPNERAIRALLYDKFRCSRREVDDVVRSVVLNRGARRGGKGKNSPALDESEFAGAGTYSRAPFRPGYSALSRAVNLYGRDTVDRALTLYGSRRPSEIEAGLPDEHAVRSFLVRRFKCDREQVEAVVKDVVLTRGARRGGGVDRVTSVAAARVKRAAADAAPEGIGAETTSAVSRAMLGGGTGSLSLERAVASARARRAEDVRSVAEIVEDHGSIGFTEEAVDFALDLVQTRAVRLSLEDDGGRMALVLPPVVDFFNHAPTNDGCEGEGNGGGWTFANARYRVEGPDLVVRSTRPLSAGEEVLIDYGSTASPQWRCLLNYGFVPGGKADAEEPPSVHDNAEIVLPRVSYGEAGVNGLDDAEVFLVRSNLVPRSLVARLALSSSQPSLANDDTAAYIGQNDNDYYQSDNDHASGVAFEFTPDVAARVADLAASAATALEALRFDKFEEMSSALLLNLKGSQLRVLRALESNIRRHQKMGWKGWNSNDVKRFVGDDGREEDMFVVV